MYCQNDSFNRCPTPLSRHDLRDALKSLRRDRSYALTVILTLALTTGATTTVFSIVNGVLIKPLAYRESHRLVALREVWRQLNRSDSPIEVNEQHFEYWRAHAATFESMAQYVVKPVNLTGSGDAAQITVVRGSGPLPKQDLPLRVHRLRDLRR